MLPVALGLGLINFNLVVNTLFAARLLDPELAPSAIDAAFRIYMLPQGIFSVAIATVLFPSLSRLAARGDLAGFRDTVSLGLRQIGFLLVPASAVGAVLAVPIVRLALRARRVHADQTTVVAEALAAFMLGLTFNGDDADAEPRLLQPSVALDPHLGRARQPRRQRGARRGVLPTRESGASRWRRRS